MQARHRQHHRQYIRDEPRGFAFSLYGHRTWRRKERIPSLKTRSRISLDHEAGERRALSSSVPLRYPEPPKAPKEGRSVSLSGSFIIVKITASSQLRFQSPKRNVDPGVPGNSLASRSESYGERRILPEERREEERPVRSPKPLPAPGILHGESEDERPERRPTVPLSPQYPEP